MSGMPPAVVTATYQNIVNQMLARGAHAGPTGQLEANVIEVGLAISRLDSSSWSFLMREIADCFGMDRAEPFVRETVRRIGRYRGDCMRREVELRGLPLDVVHLLDYWDYNTDDAVSSAKEERDPHYVAFEVMHCSFHDQMERLCPRELAIAMCEEIHIAVAKEFSPDIAVWYPALLTRGESKCIFRFSMPQEKAELEAERARRASLKAQESGRQLAGERQPQKPNPASTYRALARQHVIFYHFVADQLARTVGVRQTEDILRRAMRKWGAWRGSTMREDHLNREWPLNLHTFATYFDDPAAGDAWLAESVEVTPSHHSKDITASPYTATFEQMGTGRFAVPMREEAWAAQASAYHPEMRLEIPALMERGDPVTTLRYMMPPEMN
jgi:hypothetical protein